MRKFASFPLFKDAVAHSNVKTKLDQCAFAVGVHGISVHQFQGIAFSHCRDLPRYWNSSVVPSFQSSQPIGVLPLSPYHPDLSHQLFPLRQAQCWSASVFLCWPVDFESARNMRGAFSGFRDVLWGSFRCCRLSSLRRCLAKNKSSRLSRYVSDWDTNCVRRFMAKNP